MKSAFDPVGEKIREESLRAGQAVIARWTWRYRQFSATATFVRLNRKSIRVKLCERVEAGEGYYYPEGHGLTLARAGRRGWSRNNRVVVPDGALAKEAPQHEATQ